MLQWYKNFNNSTLPYLEKLLLTLKKNPIVLTSTFYLNVIFYKMTVNYQIVKYICFFQISVCKYPKTTLLVPNLRILIFAQNFQLRGC